MQLQLKIIVAGDNHKVLGLHLLQEDGGLNEADGHGAAMLSFRSHIKLIPEVLSNVASEGMLGRRHPDSITLLLKELKYKIDFIQCMHVSKRET